MLFTPNGSVVGASIESTSVSLIEKPPHSPQQLALWQAELDKITDPRDTKLTHLRLVWMGGDWWDPVNRYFIYQMYPKGVIPFGVSKEELEGPDPRSYAGDYDNVLKRFVRHQHLTIDRHQWRLYHETGLCGFPYWIVQGSNGGHLRRFTHVQKALSKLEGGWEEPPRPGDLPFAAPDGRTWKQLRELDQLRKYEGPVAFHLRAPEVLQGAERDRAQEMRAKMWKTLKAQQEDIWGDEGSQALRTIRNLVPVGLGRRKGPDYEAIERRFIQDD